MSLEIHASDQYVTAPASTTLAQLEAALPEDLHYRAPLIDLTLEDWVLSGGVGLLAAPPVRKDVLSLTYVSSAGAVQAGGRVVKNVSGYDLVRLVVASDPSLSHAVRLESVTLRLRPKPKIVRLEKQITNLEAGFEELRGLGAAFGLAYQTNPATWVLCGEWWDVAPNWGTPALETVPKTVWRDALGVFPRVVKVLDSLEQRVLQAL
jgi:FAD/FMN-containing dehydrogenase